MGSLVVSVVTADLLSFPGFISFNGQYLKTSDTRYPI
jgi:hypothetical protein